MQGDVMRPGTGEFGTEFGRYRHARFTPRWASRITLEVTDVHVEQLQLITPVDVKAEGVELLKTNCEGECGGFHCLIQRRPFITLWDSINGEGAWHRNPWVWAVSFRRLEVR